MSSDPEIYTLTMARVYAQQGHYDRAVAIYLVTVWTNALIGAGIYIVQGARGARQARL